MNNKIIDCIVPDFLKEFHVSNFDFLLDKSCYNFFFVKSTEANHYLTKNLSQIFDQEGFQEGNLNNQNYQDKFLIFHINDLAKDDIFTINNMFYSNFKNTNIKINFIYILNEQSNIQEDVLTPFRNYWGFGTISIFDDANHIPIYYLKNELDINLDNKQQLNKKLKI